MKSFLNHIGDLLTGMIIASLQLLENLRFHIGCPAFSSAPLFDGQQLERLAFPQRFSQSADASVAKPGQSRDALIGHADRNQNHGRRSFLQCYGEKQVEKTDNALNDPNAFPALFRDIFRSPDAP